MTKHARKVAALMLATAGSVAFAAPASAESNSFPICPVADLTDCDGGGEYLPPPWSPPSQLTVVVDELYCVETEDFSGADEPYLTANDQRIWGNGSLNNQQGTNVNASFTASNNVTIKLYDADVGSWFDTDDYIGEVRLTLADVNQGTQTRTIEGDGAEYRITYHVTG